MVARYLIRLDDALPTMCVDKWTAIENMLDKYGIKPMVAVIPDNQDKEMNFGEVNPDFWVQVKRWKDKGWAVGMHGYNHLYHSVERKNSIVPLQDQSEFVGLDLETQKTKFEKALNIFLQKGVKPDLFIAPSHSFDENTIRAMKTETELNIVSDGIALSPFHVDGVCFVPQQLWTFKYRPFGVWTICLHPNTITNGEMHELASALSKFNHLFVSLSELNLREEWYNKVFGRLFQIFFWKIYNLKRYLRPLRNKIRRVGN